MKANSPKAGKMIVHQHGTGVMTKSDVEERAQENALIEGRTHPNAEDRQQAASELTGEALPPTTATDAESFRGLTRDPSDPVANYGREIPNLETPDEQNSIERLVTEGVEEAQHEQMVAAHRRRRAS